MMPWIAKVPLGWQMISDRCGWSCVSEAYDGEEGSDGLARERLGQDLDDVVAVLVLADVAHERPQRLEQARSLLCVQRGDHVLDVRVLALRVRVPLEEPRVPQDLFQRVRLHREAVAVLLFETLAG